MIISKDDVKKEVVLGAKINAKLRDN